jgi:hypothetical protein
MILIPTVSSSQIWCKGDDNNGGGKEKQEEEEEEEESHEISATSQTKSSTAELGLYSTSRRALSRQSATLFASNEKLPTPRPPFPSLVGCCPLFTAAAYRLSPSFSLSVIFHPHFSVT